MSVNLRSKTRKTKSVLPLAAAHESMAPPLNTSYSKTRVVRRVGVVSTLAFGSLFFAACSSDDSNSKAETAVSEALTDVSSAANSVSDAVDSAVDTVTDGTGDEGMAKDLGNQVAQALGASSTGGEPVMASINEAVKVVTEPNKVTGLEDTDNDGKDDDAKFTIETNSGDDKACVQSQNGTWEVTDDEC